MCTQNLHTDVYSSCIHNYHILEATNMFFSQINYGLSRRWNIIQALKRNNRAIKRHGGEDFWEGSEALTATNQLLKIWNPGTEK